MKPSTRKLALRKESVRTLTVLDLARVHGGVDAATAFVAGETGKKECTALLVAAEYAIQAS